MLKLKRTVVCQVLFLCSLVLVPLSAFAASSITVTQAGNSSFVLLASGLSSVHGIDATVSFDSARLTNPRVVQGTLATGAMFIANTNLPGSVRIAMVTGTPLKGSGPIATINFDLIGDSSGSVGLTGSAIDVNGKPLSVAFNGYAVSTGSGSSDTADTGTTGSTGSSTGSGSTTGGSGSTGTGTTTTATGTTTTATGTGSMPFVVGGTLTMPSDESGAREHKEAVGQPQPTPQEQPAAPAPSASEPPAVRENQPAAKKAPAFQPRPVQSVLEKFRLFAGVKTPKSLVALFDRDPGAPFSQVPQVCIADGKASVLVTVSKVPGEKDPSFTFDHASYLSLNQIGDGEWQIEVRPEKGTLQASINMLLDGAQQGMPLTVAPRVDVDLDKSGTVTEADFQLFLATRGTDAAPKFDLNGDGKRDYQDDYIFTANYLAMKTAGSKNEAPAQKAP